MGSTIQWAWGLDRTERGERKAHELNPSLSQLCFLLSQCELPFLRWSPCYDAPPRCMGWTQQRLRKHEPEQNCLSLRDFPSSFLSQYEGKRLNWNHRSLGGPSGLSFTLDIIMTLLDGVYLENLEPFPFHWKILTCRRCHPMNYFLSSHERLCLTPSSKYSCFLTHSFSSHSY